MLFIFGLILSARIIFSAPLNIEYFKNLVETYEQKNPGQTLNIPEVLHLLPDELKSRYTLMYRSASAERSSFENPRVILFGHDASTIVGFNGHNSQSGFNRLELVFFNEQQMLPEFYSMNFPADDSKTGKVRFSNKNPVACARCHSKGYHYKWRQYAFWNGAYGSRDDVLELGGSEGSSPIPVDEKSEFIKFKQRAKSHNRYSALRSLVLNPNPIWPFRPLTAGKKGTNRGDYGIQIEYRPNMNLGMLLMRFEAKGLARALLNAKEFDLHKFRIGFLLAGCQKDGALEEIHDIIKKLGINKEDFHLFKNVDDFNAGLSTHFAAVFTELFQKEFVKFENFKKYYFPLNMVDLLNNAAIDVSKIYADSNFGIQLWSAIDKLLPTQSDGYGSREMTTIFRISGVATLGSEKNDALCKEFAAK